jgi:hypothetical protein
MKPLSCQKCKTELHPADIDVDNLRAVCRHCGWAFGVSSSPYRQDTSLARVKELPIDGLQRRPNLPRPAAVDITSDPVPTIVYRQPSEPLANATLIGTVVMFTVGAVGKMLADGFVDLAWAFSAVGLVALYMASAAVLNRWIIELGEFDLTVRRGPLPTVADRTIDWRDIDQLYVVQSSNAAATHYSLMARLSDKSVALVSLLDNPLHALFIEQVIEHHLGIDDAYVDGEYLRD